MKYYKCSAGTDLEKKLLSFHMSLSAVQESAAGFAQKCGASYFIENAENMAGGVDYLEFEKTPDLEVWRKRDFGDGQIYYEPRVTSAIKCLVLPTEGNIPENSETCIYGKSETVWERARGKHPIEYWAHQAEYQLTGNEEQDWQCLDSLLHNRRFVYFLEMSADDSEGKQPQNKLRKAMSIEKERLNLPVVTVETLLGLLECSPAKGEKHKRVKYTPKYFFLDGFTYLSVPFPCGHKDLSEVTEEEFEKKLSEATNQNEG